MAHSVDAANDSIHRTPLKQTLRWLPGAAAFVLTIGLWYGLLPGKTASDMMKGAGSPHDAIGLSSAPLMKSRNRSKLVAFRMRRGIKRNSSEWEVVAGILHVRTQPSISSSLCGLKQQGQILVGHNAAGNWVKLKHEPGWVAISVGNTVLLRHRSVTYSQLLDGSCTDAASFPIIEGTACLAAALALGHHVERLPSFKGKDQPEGCYIQGSELWMGSKTRKRGHGILWMQNSSSEQLCSSGRYASISDGYMDQQEVAVRMKQVAQSLSESKRKCPSGSSQPNPCIVLWSMHARDFVRKGFGATMGLFETLRAYSTYSGCTWAVSEAFAKDWTKWKLGLFWASVVPNDQWQARFAAASICGNLNVSFWSPLLPLKCENNPPSAKGEGAFVRSPACNGPGPPTGVFKGAYDLYTQTLGPRLQAYHTPFTETYAAIHIRHGDKIYESPKWLQLESTVTILKQYWPHVKNVFLASGGAQVISDAKMVLGSHYTIATTSEMRWISGTPEANFNERVHDDDDDDDAVDAVLDDISGLASAPVLIGAMNSNFFNTALTINVNLHAKLLRRKPWCWDVFHGRFCD
mmetsp:Transcript_91062/g.175299  ORF Transcript_91062/g.175299 Transcript_91062/m.175299 type:complete len:577 (-) Transcript_91062:243-1973(-)